MTEPHDAPDLDVLLEAVRDFLALDVVEHTEGTTRFHARVAANALGIVLRQRRLGDWQQAAHRKRLRRLGFVTDAELAAAIRSGSLDDRYDEVAAAVREAVREKLLVANPGYLGVEPG